MDSIHHGSTCDSQLRSLQHGYLTILDLPDELLLGILLRLNLEAIFILRRVCRRMTAVSKAKSLWIILFGRLREQVPGLWDGSNYETLDTLELERLVVRAVRLEENWSSESPTCTRPPKQFRVKESYVRYLVPGGRWLISGLFDGSSRLVYTDLDSPTPGQSDLLRHPQPEFVGEVRRIALHLETDYDALAFTIAVTYLSPGALDGEEDAYCSVWHVQLEESERFSVSHRFLFPLAYPEDFGIDSFVMNQNLLLRGTDDRHARVFEVFDYRKCSDHQVRRGLVVLPRESSSPHVHALRIMPHDQFLVVASGILQLFNIPELSDVPATSLHPSTGLGYPVWTYKYEPCIPGCLPAITPPHLAFRRSNNSLFGLLIQASRVFLYVNFPQEASNLLDVHEAVMEQEADWMNALLGSHRGAWYDRKAEGSPLYLTTFGTPGSKSVARELAGTGLCESHRPEMLSLRLTSYGGLPENKANRNHFYFDEASGRVLIPVHIPYTAFMLMEFT